MIPAKLLEQYRTVRQAYARRFPDKNVGESPSGETPNAVVEEVAAMVAALNGRPTFTIHESKTPWKPDRFTDEGAPDGQRQGMRAGEDRARHAASDHQFGNRRPVQRRR